MIMLHFVFIVTAVTLYVVCRPDFLWWHLIAFGVTVGILSGVLFG
jgi:hypothetical protein